MLLYSRFCWSAKRKSETAVVNTDSQWSKMLVLQVPVTTSVSLLANECDVQSILHGQMSLAVVNQNYVIHEAMNGCKNLKIY